MTFLLFRTKLQKTHFLSSFFSFLVTWEARNDTNIMSKENNCFSCDIKRKKNPTLPPKCWVYWEQWHFILVLTCLYLNSSLLDVFFFSPLPIMHTQLTSNFHWSWVSWALLQMLCLHATLPPPPIFLLRIMEYVFAYQWETPDSVVVPKFPYLFKVFIHTHTQAEWV